MREDDEYWSDKYAEASCYEHGEEWMDWDEILSEWTCRECE